MDGIVVHRPFYISICISTLPTQHTMFISLLVSVIYTIGMGSFKKTKNIVF